MRTETIITISNKPTIGESLSDENCKQFKLTRIIKVKPISDLIKEISREGRNAEVYLNVQIQERAKVNLNQNQI